MATLCLTAGAVAVTVCAESVADTSSGWVLYAIRAIMKATATTIYIMVCMWLLVLTWAIIVMAVVDVRDRGSDRLLKMAKKNDHEGFRRWAWLLPMAVRRRPNFVHQLLSVCMCEGSSPEVIPAILQSMAEHGVLKSGSLDARLALVEAVTRRHHNMVECLLKVFRFPDAHVLEAANRFLFECPFLATGLLQLMPVAMVLRIRKTLLRRGSVTCVRSCDCSGCGVVMADLAKLLRLSARRAVWLHVAHPPPAAGSFTGNPCKAQ